MRSRLEAWFAVLDSGLSPNVISRLVEAAGGPGEVLGATHSFLQHEVGLKPEQLRRLQESARDTARRRRQLDLFDQHEMQLAEPGDDSYPARLMDLKHAPPVLFFRGEINPDDKFAVALVGPRMATPYGLEVTRRLATELAPMMTIVSGLAIGIDTAAHEAAINAAGRTIGVAACSLDQDYPKGNERVRQQIPSSGAIISAYPPLTKAATHHFPIRNVLMAGIVMAVVVIEASESSGALLTAQAAADESREVFAVPGDITRRNSRGSNGLIAQGAGMATCAQDIIAGLGERLARELAESRGSTPFAESQQPEIPPDLPQREAELLARIHHHELQYDDLLAEFVPAYMTLGELTTALLQLEIKGLVKQAPGKIFMPAMR